MRQHFGAPALQFGGGALLLLAWADMGETRAPGLPAPRLADWVALLRSSRYWAYVLCTAFSVVAL